MGHTLNRRAAIAGALVSSAALALPVTAAVQKDETPDEEVERCIQALGKALVRQRPGIWFASVHDTGVVMFCHRPDARNGLLRYEPRQI